MMAETVNPRIVKVLNKLLEPNFKLKDDAFLNSLLTHLTNKSNDNENAVFQQDANEELLLLWMKQAISYWEEIKTISNTLTFTFTLNLMRYMSRDEQTFLKINNDRTFDRLLAIIVSYFKGAGIQANIELAYIKLLSSLLNHASGLQWIISNDRWEFVLKSSLYPRTIYISREGYEFMASMLEKSAAVDSSYAKSILGVILTPLLNATNEHGSEVALCQSVYLLSKILETFLESKNEGNIKEITLILDEHFNLEKILKTLTTSTKEGDFLFDLYKLSIIWCFLINYVKCNDKLVTQLFGIYFDTTSRLPVLDMIKLCHLSLMFWNNVKSKLPPIRECKSSEWPLENQLLSLQLLPAYSMCNTENEGEDQYRFQFVQEFFETVPPHMIRVFYKWRTYLRDDIRLTDGIQAFKYFLHSKEYYSTKNAIIVFTCLMYTLMDLTDLLTRRPEWRQAILDQPDYIILLLKCIKDVIVGFTITWKDSVESVSVLSIINELLSITAWPAKIVTNSLQLMEKALMKYMTPEMALLLDDSRDIILNSILPMLKVKLLDSDWGVRVSAIELIRTVTIITYKKFSFLVNIVLENDFPTSILLMATVDVNSSVRASSLKCLQEMTKVDEFWDVLIHRGHILEKVSRIMYVEQEGIVRTEAAALIDSIYKNHEVPDAILSTFYDIMHHAVTADLHWETRVKALEFWKNVIDKHLSQQGMIDGDFPEFTFSKEKRKIVNLNEAEIKTRLLKVLDQLSRNGCLSAFHFALGDDCDLEVTKYATSAIEDFASLLKKYKIVPQDVTTESPISDLTSKFDDSKLSANFESKTKCENSSCSSLNNSVMDEVLDSLDANLLESIFNSLDYPPDDYVEIQTRRMLAPKDFLESVNSDLTFHVKQKSKWIEGIDNFDSLLDDILKEYDVNDINEMDCY